MQLLKYPLAATYPLPATLHYSFIEFDNLLDVYLFAQQNEQSLSFGVLWAWPSATTSKIIKENRNELNCEFDHHLDFYFFLQKLFYSSPELKREAPEKKCTDVIFLHEMTHLSIDEICGGACDNHIYVSRRIYKYTYNYIE